ncbi:hypothetical protein MRX96_050955 [Rhipicephalus microplus]
MALEAFYEKEHWRAIQTALEHVCWPLCFTWLGFVFTNPGERMSGHVFTWKNSFLNAFLYEWGCKKTLNISLKTNLDDYLPFEVDEDDNYHIYPTHVINITTLHQNLESIIIKIQLKTREEYRTPTASPTMTISPTTMHQH